VSSLEAREGAESTIIPTLWVGHHGIVTLAKAGAQERGGGWIPAFAGKTKGCCPVIVGRLFILLEALGNRFFVSFRLTAFGAGSLMSADRKEMSVAIRYLKGM